MGTLLLIPPTQDTLYSGSICNRPGTDRRCYGIPYIRHRKRYIYDEKVATLIGFLFFCHQIGAFFSAWLGGICVAMTGNYILVWILDIVLCLFASAASFKIPREEKGVLY